MKHPLYTILIVTLVSCHSRKYLIVRDFESSDKKNITLDNSYDFYVREIYRDSTGQTFTLKTELTKNSKLIEMEYLLYSKDQAKLVYITTVPDKYQKYYSNWRLNDPTLLNAYDFNTFHVGKITNEEIVFQDIKNNRTSIIWEIEKAPESLTIERIIEKKGSEFQSQQDVEKSLSNGAVFRRIPQFQIVLRNYLTPDADMLKVTKPVIYVGKRNKKYCALYFQFDDSIPVKVKFLNRSGSEKKESEYKSEQQFTTILFKGFKRVQYNPIE